LTIFEVATNLVGKKSPRFGAGFRVVVDSD